MKRTASVALGGILISLVAACSDQPEWRDGVPVDHTEVCIDAEHVIHAPEDCERGAAGRSWIYVPGNSHVGAHGTKLNAPGVPVKPVTGVIGRAPASGGFGTHGGTVAG
jgi:hypothetical protein